MECIGFGEYEGKCTNKAGTKWGPYWCESCNKLRLDHIDKRLQGITNHLEQIKAGGMVDLGTKGLFKEATNE